jgi:hypothetical protein
MAADPKYPARGGLPHLIGGTRSSPCTQQPLHHCHMSVLGCPVHGSVAKLQQQAQWEGS